MPNRRRRPTFDRPRFSLRRHLLLLSVYSDPRRPCPGGQESRIAFPMLFATVRGEYVLMYTHGPMARAERWSTPRFPCAMVHTPMPRFRRNISPTPQAPQFAPSQDAQNPGEEF